MTDTFIDPMVNLNKPEYDHSHREVVYQTNYNKMGVVVYHAYGSTANAICKIIVRRAHGTIEERMRRREAKYFL